MGCTPRSTAARGAYGLRIQGLEHPLLLDVERDWPVIEVTARLGPGSSAEDVVGADTATIALTDGGEIALDRRAATARLTLPLEVERDAIVHPYLAPVAAIFGHWLGRESLHGGAFEANGAAWAVLGGRGAGKSSLLARLAADG